MRKIISSILALAMALSLCTISAQAGTEGKYALTYEAIGETDINNLKAGDMFWAVVTLKGAEGIFAGGIGLSWDNTKIQTVNASGTSNKVFGVITEAASRIVATAKTTGMNMDSGEMEQVAALEYNTQAATENSVTYEFSAAQVYDENGEGAFNDYYVSGDTTIVKIRFKVLEVADPSITVTKSLIQETKADADVRTAGFDVAAFPVGGADEPEVPTGTTATEVKDAGNADKKIAAYDIANDENVKRVLIFTEEQTALTSESRFIVTGEGRTQKFGGDIWDRVGSVEGEGIMKVAKVIFGLIVDASATADDFTFSVGK